MPPPGLEGLTAIGGGTAASARRERGLTED
jgi:hypothetical protein